MPIITIDDISYDLDKLSSDTRAQVEMVMAAEQRALELKRDLAICQTARNAYLTAAKALLQKENGFSAG